jgi:hypothetical protein
LFDGHPFAAIGAHPHGLPARLAAGEIARRMLRSRSVSFRQLLT